MNIQLLKSVSDLKVGDTFYKGDIKFTILEMESPEYRPVATANTIDNLLCVAMLLESSGGLTGWDHYVMTDDVCNVSPAQYKAMQK